MEETDLKVCVKCEESKPLSQFVRCKSRPNGIRNHCRACGRKQVRASYYKNAETINAKRRAKVAADPEKYRSYFKNYYETNAGRIQEVILKSRYGITPEELEAIVERQGSKCPICLSPLTTPCVDHDHRCCPGKTSCGKCVRGALCGKCNAGIGLLRDDRETLLRAADYVALDKSKQEVNE